MTSHVLYKTRCPECAKKGKDKHGDNLGVYSDGHTYCFSCGAGSGGTLSSKINQQKKEIKSLRALPEDTDTWLAPEAMDWLHKYFTDTKDFPLCFWSEQERWLIFPIMDKEQRNLLAWQYRYFGNNNDHPKWVGYGITEALNYIVYPRTPSRSLVLVEDLISANKVGQVLPTMCLFGSNVSLRRLANIKQLGYHTVFIWLDWDKKEYAIAVAQQAQMLGILAYVIHTKEDPKECSDKEINELLIPSKETIQL